MRQEQINNEKNQVKEASPIVIQQSTQTESIQPNNKEWQPTQEQQ